MSEKVAPRNWAVTWSAVAAGLAAGLFGTSLHGHVLYSKSMAIPLGAIGALLLLASLELFVALWSRSAWVAVLTGAAAYFFCGLLSLPHGGIGLISNNLQGNVWIYGIAVVTALLAWGTVISLRKSAPKG